MRPRTRNVTVGYDHVYSFASSLAPVTASAYDEIRRENEARLRSLYALRPKANTAGILD